MTSKQIIEAIVNKSKSSIGEELWLSEGQKENALCLELGNKINSLIVKEIGGSEERAYSALLRFILRKALAEN